MQVVDELEKKMLERILELKNLREEEVRTTTGRVKHTIRFIHQRLSNEFEKLEWSKVITDSKGKKRNVEKFGLATLYRLLDDGYHNNVNVRLERMSKL